MDLIVHINGWPGSGKLTIARLLAGELNARLLDNHLLLNPAEALFERSDPLHTSLRKAIRIAVLEHASRLAPGIPLVFTDALAEDEWDCAVFEDYRELARKRSARLVAVTIACSPEENIRRLSADGRAEAYKLTKPGRLSALRARYQLLRPESVERIDLDVTALTAAEAADTILKSIQSHACHQS